MTIEIALLISIITTSFGLWQGTKNQKRKEKHEIEEDTNQMTRVMVKLDMIIDEMKEIKTEMRSVRGEVKENRERIINLEASTKQAHERIDFSENKTGFLKFFKK